MTVVEPPSDVLRYKVHGPGDLESFLETGARCAHDVRAALEAVGADISQMSTVLDFGCGCGRTLRWFAELAPKVELFGTDIDEEAIAWCRSHLDFSTFGVNQRFPPLDHGDQSFDVIYAISVFSHIDAPDQQAWLAEFKRILRPGGMAVLSVHGEQRAAGLLDDDEERQLRDHGFLFVDCNFMDDLFPKWYQIAYQTEEFARREYGRLFEVAAYRPKGMNDDQDVVVLRRR